MDEFLSRCRYVQGEYDSRDSFLDLYQVMRRAEGGEPSNRFYYLAIPPSVFVDVARAIGDAGLVSCGSDEPWSRVVIEKPFGRDRESSDELTKAISHVFSEDQTNRIDHYLGKEVIQNLLILRFANIIFEPLWNNRFVESVQIVWKENIGLEGRGSGRFVISVPRSSGPDRVSVTHELLGQVERLVFLVTGPQKEEAARMLLPAPEKLAAGRAVAALPRVELWRA